MTPTAALHRAIDRLGTAHAVAGRLGVAPATVRQWRSRGSVPLGYRAAVEVIAAEPSTDDLIASLAEPAPVHVALADHEPVHVEPTVHVALAEPEAEPEPRHPLLGPWPTGPGEAAEIEPASFFRGPRFRRPGALAAWLRAHVGERLAVGTGLALLSVERWRSKRALHAMDRVVIHPHPGTLGDCGLVLLARDDGTAEVGTSPADGCTWIASCEGTVELRGLLASLDRGEPLLPAAAAVARAFARRES